MSPKKSARKSSRKPSGSSGTAAGQEEVFTLSTLEQVKTLADPLRVRILESLCEARTTKQVADLLEERPTKLYHHVDALERAGLIRLVRTRQNRGTLEKYYQAVARAFRTDPLLFAMSPTGEKMETMGRMLSTVFTNTQMDLQRLISAETGAADLEEGGILSYLEVQASEREIKSIQAKLEKLIKTSCEKTEAPPREKKTRRYRLTVAFFPLDRMKRQAPDPTDGPDGPDGDDG